ncbi:hypothetical protein [uncultured Psychrobacter sp.]|uniref:hypothetical protein n=2 Tax=uncultured Psychrobacter sp. TaxID=259303 RepID=UPI003457F7A2
MNFIKKNIRSIIKPSTAILTGLVTMGVAMNTAHSELSIQEKDPKSSIVNQYAALKNTDAKSPKLHALITDLNQRIALNPKDSLAWEILAQIYYNNGYYAYAVYAASEAVDLGQSTPKLKKILLNSSAIVSESQLEAEYLTDDVDAEFLKDYQYALSKIYGEVYGFNYDESLPKPPAPIVKPKAVKTKSKISAHRRTPVKKKARSAPVKKKAAVKPKATPKASPIKKPTPSKNSNSKATDPFSILR